MMTIPEIVLALDDDLSKPQPPPGAIVFDDPMARMAWFERRRRMTPMERLQEARERFGYGV